MTRRKEHCNKHLFRTLNPSGCAHKTIVYFLPMTSPSSPGLNLVPCPVAVSTTIFAPLAVAVPAATGSPPQLWPAFLNFHKCVFGVSPPLGKTNALFPLGEAGTIFPGTLNSPLCLSLLLRCLVMEGKGVCVCGGGGWC